MATKAELETELAALKRELADRKATADAAPEEPGDGDDGAAAGGGRQALLDMLKAHGVDPGDLDIDRLWQQLSEEMGDVMRKRPAMTAIAIFALGFILGRATR